MNRYKQRMQDLFDGDLGIDAEYHQDYRGTTYPSFTQIGFILPLILCLIPVIYHILHILDYDLLPLPELVWNYVVYLTPSRLLDAIETYTNPLRIPNPTSRHIPRTHAAKSEAMRRILGLDKPGGIIGSVAQASRRRLSSLPGISVTSSGADGRPAGLGNWDNSCYQNSVLQGLASLDSLSRYLTNPSIDVRIVKGKEKPEMKMAEALKELIATLNDPQNNGRKIWTPAALKNMSSWQQQDAQEYFSKVLDEIDKEVGKAAKLVRRSQGFGVEGTGSSTQSQQPLSIYRNPLEGLIAQRVGCTKCGYSEGFSMIPFNCLTVPLGKSWGQDITECLDEYTKLENIEGVECGKCTLLKSQRLLSTILDRTKDSPDGNHIHRQSTERLEAVNSALEEDNYDDKTLLHKCKIPPKSRVSATKTRQAVIARPPRSLVAHFNRSLFDEQTGELRKNHSEVRFPKFLDLGSWSLGSLGSGDEAGMEEWLLNPEKPMIASSSRPSRIKGPIYELRAVVTHYGRHENGHYICYRKHPPATDSRDPEKKGQWWRLSDDDVMKVSEDNVLGQGGVFMLFYDCIEPATPLSAKTAPLQSAPSVQLQSTVPAEPVPPEPLRVLEQSNPEDIALAINTPIPEVDDTDFSSISDQNTIDREGSATTATSVSDFKDEEIHEGDKDDYDLPQPIIVPPYIQQTGGKKQNEGVLPGSTGSLLMV
ncbi:Cysteine proteinase [Venustampulla echinocandica]|uniref:ubiquitinyl hydrolase 1 n=1 Tax=Venustampulla echinocandica TaxID=2656787 RepID=A0A370TV68_9HELO|nr:Cysteine proteinase [Venustampulla echinocandica]RDL39421.1 Cysteine proteinase [Venustampulla echinocandica]